MELKDLILKRTTKRTLVLKSEFDSFEKNNEFIYYNFPLDFNSIIQLSKVDSCNKSKLFKQILIENEIKLNLINTSGMDWNFITELMLYSVKENLNVCFFLSEKSLNILDKDLLSKFELLTL